MSQGFFCRPESRVVRFRCILLDENLSFGNTVSSLGIVRKLRHTFPESILKLLFSALSSHMFLIALLHGCLFFRLHCGHFLSCITKHGVWLWTPTVPHQHRSQIHSLFTVFFVFQLSFISFTAIFQNLFKKLLCLFLTQLHIAFILHTISVFRPPLLFDQISIPSLLFKRSGTHYLLQYRESTPLELLKDS